MQQDVKKYFAQAPDHRQARLRILHDLIVSLYPKADLSLEYKMPTYRCGDGWVALANRKNYISLYTCSAEHLREFKIRHPGIKTGTGCINLRDGDDPPLDDIKIVIRHAIEQPKA